MLNLSKFIPNNFYKIQKMGIFEKMKERYMRTKQSEEVSDDEMGDIPFRKFTDFLLQRKEYKWNDYLTMVDVIIF